MKQGTKQLNRSKYEKLEILFHKIIFAERLFGTISMEVLSRKKPVFLQYSTIRLNSDWFRKL